jgi:hypothetical protein
MPVQKDTVNYLTSQARLVNLFYPSQHAWLPIAHHCITCRKMKSIVTNTIISLQRYVRTYISIFALERTSFLRLKKLVFASHRQSNKLYRKTQEIK